MTGARLGRRRFGTIEQAQPGANNLAGTLVSAGGDEALDEAAKLCCQGDMEAVVGWHNA